MKPSLARTGSPQLNQNIKELSQDCLCWACSAMEKTSVLDGLNETIGYALSDIAHILAVFRLPVRIAPHFRVAR